MKKYTVRDLTASTSRADGARLTEHLRGVNGVTKVELHAEVGEVWISSQPVRGPRSQTERVEEAASKAGFTLAVAD